LAASLGVWADGFIPGILSVDEIADDVSTDNVDFLLQHKEVGAEGMDATILNSKGFGGNNASASILAPHIVEKMLEKRHGADKIKQYKTRNESIKESSAAYETAANEGKNSIIYKFDHHVMGRESIELSTESINIAGIDPAVDLKLTNSYEDMCD
jgi:acetoacetyl-[acyl-carrier protein] synthase